MLKWVVRGLILGGAAGVSYVAGQHQGGRKVARLMLTDRTLGRQVIERLAAVHGLKLELFEIDPEDEAGA